MRIFIRTNSKGFVYYQNNFPFDPIDGTGKTEEEMLEEGYLLESIPQIDQVEGKLGYLYYTPEKGFWTEYIDKIQKISIEDRVSELENYILSTEGVI